MEEDSYDWKSARYEELRKQYISMSMTLETLKGRRSTREGNINDNDLKEEIRKLEQNIIEQRELMNDEYTRCNRIRLDKMKEQGEKRL